MQKQIEKSNPDKQTLYWLLGGIHLSALPIYPDMPLAILLLVALLSLWQIYIIRGLGSLPTKITQLLIIATACLVILYSYGHILGQQPGIALITLMTFLKLFEIKDNRDCYIVIYSAIFIIASNFFHSQTIWLILYVFCTVIYLTSILIMLSDRLNSVSLGTRLTMATRYYVFALPLMLVLFVLFPRLPGPLWGLPNDAFSDQAGLSEEMSPGSINKLISSSAIAFRVKFDNEIPSQEQRYWRGAVLSSYDGKTWRRKDAPASTEANIEYTNIEDNYRYRVTLEPNNLKWLLTLEYPSDYNQKYDFTREAMLLTDSKINNVINYTVSSQLSASNAALFSQESYKNRLLPSGLNPKTIEFAQQLMRQSDFDQRRYIENVLAHFSNNGFIYTLSPDLLGANAMDDFLFQTKRGFCEHYASAFTYLMRAAGIPARVVLGYQGGIMNPLDDYMIVRQSDAHAWSEVWHDNRWRRIDPTAAVSPERVEQGIQNAGLERNRLPMFIISNNATLQNIVYLYDSFQHQWNQWVIGFDEDKQNALLKKLGFEQATASNLILLLVSCMFVTGLIVTWLVLKQVSKNTDQIQHLYNLFCLKLKKLGIEHPLSEGPLDLENRLLKEESLNTKTKHEIRFILSSYRRLHYGVNTNDKLIKAFKKKIRRFPPGKKPD